MYVCMCVCVALGTKDGNASKRIFSFYRGKRDFFTRTQRPWRASPFFLSQLEDRLHLGTYTRIIILSPGDTPQHTTMSGKQTKLPCLGGTCALIDGKNDGLALGSAESTESELDRQWLLRVKKEYVGSSRHLPTTSTLVKPSEAVLPCNGAQYPSFSKMLDKGNRYDDKPRS
jgi:hypothetical protein